MRGDTIARLAWRRPRGTAVPELNDDDIEEYISTLETHFSDQLTVWEIGFLESIKEQWEVRKFLTIGQKNKLNEIMEKYSRGFQGRHHE